MAILLYHTLRLCADATIVLCLTRVAALHGFDITIWCFAIAACPASKDGLPVTGTPPDIPVKGDSMALISLSAEPIQSTKISTEKHKPLLRHDPPCFTLGYKDFSQSSCHWALYRTHSPQPWRIPHSRLRHQSPRQQILRQQIPRKQTFGNRWLHYRSGLA